MATVNLPSVKGAQSLEEVINTVENMRKQIEFLFGNVENDNIRGIIKANKLQVGDITNLVVNSDFSEGTDGWGVGNKIISDPGHEGTVGSKVVEQSERDGYAGADFPVSEAEQFHVGCWAFGGYSTKGFNMGIRFMRPDGNYVWVAGPHWDAGEGWGYKEKTVDAPSGTIFGHVWFQIDAFDTFGRWLYDKAFARRVGLITFDRAEGGAIKLGEKYGDGQLHIYNSAGNIVGRIDTNGGYFPKIQADNIIGNVVNKYTFSVTDTIYFDCDNGNDVNGGSSGSPKKDPQVFINNLPKDLNYSTVTLKCKGSRGGTFVVRGFRNGRLNITDWDNNYGFNVNGLWAEDNTCNVDFSNTTVWGMGGGGNAMVHAFDCSNVQFYNIKAYGGSGQSHGYWSYNSYVRIGECHVYNIGDRGLYAADGSKVYTWNCKGSAPVGLSSDDGSWITGAGSRWAGSLVRSNNALLGSVGTNNVDWEMNLWSINYGEAAPPPDPIPPPATEQTLNISPSTGDNYSTQGFWTDNEVKQGNWGYGDRYGIWYVDLSAVKGKTILSATITVTRNSGGNSGARTIYFRTHNYTARGQRPSGTPAMSAVGATGSVAIGGQAQVDITSMIQNHIANGVDRSIGIHTTGQTDYMNLGITPSISIRYR